MEHIIKIWREKIGGDTGLNKCEDYRWLKEDQPYKSIKNAIILRMMIHLPEVNEYESLAKEFRDFLMDLLADVPHRTTNNRIYGLVCAAVQMCGYSGETADAFIDLIIAKDCREAIRNRAKGA